MTGKKKVTLILAPVALAAGLMVWEGCSGSDPVVHSGPASKPVAGGFRADRGTDYDPFQGMSEDQRIDAIGGADAALDYFKVIAAQLASAMDDTASREILSENVPEWETGEAELSKLLIDSPHLLAIVSSGLRSSVVDIEGDLTSNVIDTSSDEEALLKVVEALFDLEVVLATPPGQEWDPSEEIPIFFDPIHDGATIVEGIDVDGNPVSLSADATEASYPLLAINFNEDRSLEDHYLLTGAQQTMYQKPLYLDGLDRIWNFSMISAAYAHHEDGHAECYHSNVFQPIKAITIYKDHDPGFWNKPEVMVTLSWNNGAVVPEGYNLEKVDKINKRYTTYESVRSYHGHCDVTLNKFRVWEDDPVWDDHMATFTNVNVYQTIELEDEDEVLLEVRETAETADTD